MPEPEVRYVRTTIRPPWTGWNPFRRWRWRKSKRTPSDLVSADFQRHIQAQVEDAFINGTGDKPAGLLAEFPSAAYTTNEAALTKEILEDAVRHIYEDRGRYGA